MQRNLRLAAIFILWALGAGVWEEAAEMDGGSLSPSAQPSLPHVCLPPPKLGVLVQGFVWLDEEAGPGLADASIYLRYDSYPAKQVAISDQDGYYWSGLVYFRGDAMVTVWAELDGHTFDPEMYSWQHYDGFETRTLDFVAIPPSIIYLPLVVHSD